MTNDKPFLLPDERERQTIREALDTNLLVEAAAGTGKTTCLISRAVALIREGKCSIDSMAAVTFTRKAAAEMRSRFQIDLEKEYQKSAGVARQRILDALNGIERCFIGTIHSFCARLLRERPVEANVDVGFTEIDDFDDEIIRREAWNEYVAKLYAENNPILQELNEAGLEIGQLRQTYQRIIDYPDVEEWPAPKVKLPDLDSVRSALLDYISHMEEINPSLPDDAGSDTLIPKYQRIPRLLRYHDLEQPDQLMEVLQEFIKCKITQKNWPGGKNQALEESQRWNEFMTVWVEPVLSVWLANRYEICLRIVHPAQAYYERYKKQLGVLNYQDLLMTAARLLKQWPQVREYFNSRLSHLLVDEFQDTDPIQAEVMMLLSSDDISTNEWRACRPRPGSLFVVGDPKQSIYRFRRADIVTYNQVKEILINNDGQVLHLSANFRSDPAVIQWINDVFRDSFPPEASPYSPIYSLLELGTPRVGLPVEETIQRLAIPAELKKNEECLTYEADLIARIIRREIDERNANPGDFLLVAYRTRNLKLYAERLQQYQIPHRVTGGDALNQIEELRLLTLCLSAVADSSNAIALVSVLRGDLFGFSDPELYEFKKNGGIFSFTAEPPDSLPAALSSKYGDAFERLRLYQRWFKSLPPSSALEKVADHLGLFAYASAHPGGDVHCGSLAKVLSLIRSSYERFTTQRDILDFLNHLIQQEILFDGVSANPPEESAVRIMNLHKVKGLQAPVVFLADPTGRHQFGAEIFIDRSQATIRGFMEMKFGREGSKAKSILLAKPQQWEEMAAEEEKYLEAEKIRLLYVAATRPEKQLIISQRETNNRYNPWEFFDPFLSDKTGVVNTKAVLGEIPSPMPSEMDEIDKRISAVDRRREEISRPTYSILAAAQTADDYEERSLVREEGAEWGDLIHALLESALRNIDGDLSAIASRLIQDRGLNSAWAAAALRMANAVRSSEIWERAICANPRLAEVPFCVSHTGGDSLDSLPTICRGVIDLVFKEKEGWVIVDYKTDLSARENVASLIDYYRPQIRNYARIWRQIANEPVREAGLFFTEINQFYAIE